MLSSEYQVPIPSRAVSMRSITSDIVGFSVSLQSYPRIDTDWNEVEICELPYYVKSLIEVACILTPAFDLSARIYLFKSEYRM